MIYIYRSLAESFDCTETPRRVDHCTELTQHLGSPGSCIHSSLLTLHLGEGGFFPSPVIVCFVPPGASGGGEQLPLRTPDTCPLLCVYNAGKCIFNYRTAGRWAVDEPVKLCFLSVSAALLLMPWGTTNMYRSPAANQQEAEPTWQYKRPTIAIEPPTGHGSALVCSPVVGDPCSMLLFGTPCCPICISEITSL